MNGDGTSVLARDECLRRLGGGGVGRVAVTVRALPAIFPVNYVVIDDEIVFATVPGTGLAAATSDAVVAFEVDNIDAGEDRGWSVMIVGRSEEITDRAQMDRLRRLRLSREIHDHDPPSYVRIRSGLISGRRLSCTPMAHDRG